MKTRDCFFIFCVVAVVPAAVRANEVPEKYRETVRKGLDYLAAKQHKDGHWEGDDGKHPVAMTALAGIALSMESKRPFKDKSKYAANLNGAVRWLMDSARPSGLIYSGHPSEASQYMYGHGLAMLFLASIYHDWCYAVEFEDDEKLTYVLRRAIKYTAKSQSTEGGWYQTSTSEGHDLHSILATVIQQQALYCVGHKCIAPPHGIYDADIFLTSALQKLGSEPKQVRCVDWAAILSRFVDDEHAAKLLTLCKDAIPMGKDLKFGRDELVHYFFAQVQYLRGHQRDRIWLDYRSALFDHLQAHQNADGSWPAGNGLSVGPVYSTALWCTVLQLDRNSHPLAFRPRKTKSE